MLITLFSTLLNTGCVGRKYELDLNSSSAGLVQSLEYDLKLGLGLFTLKLETEQAGSGTAVTYTFGGSFSMELKTIQSGKLEKVKNKENVYKLTTTKLTYSSYECEGKGSGTFTKTYRSSLKASEYISSKEAEKIVEGKRVSIKLDKDDYFVSYSK